MNFQEIDGAHEHFFPPSDILLTYFSSKILYLDITSMTTSPVQFGRELWFGWSPVLKEDVGYEKERFLAMNQHNQR